VHRRLVCDVPARWLIDESKDAQLVVLGSRRPVDTPGMQLGLSHFGGPAVRTSSGHRWPVTAVMNFTDRKPPERAINVKGRDPTCERMGLTMS